MKLVSQAMVLAAVLLAPAAAAPTQSPYTYRGTVHAVKDGSVSILTGVGYAVRLVRVRTLPTTVVAAATAGSPGPAGPTARAAPVDLAPGDVVRADCRMTDAGLVADRIEIQRRAP